MAVRVLIVDDSALMRQMLTSLLHGDDLHVVGAAENPLVAREMIKALNPDVLTLDVEMPRMDGLDFLSRLMSLRPMPVVMISSLTQEHAEAALRALELGAVDCIAKPQTDLAKGMEAMREDMRSRILAAAKARVRPLTSRTPKTKPAHGAVPFTSSEKIVVIGASTGGVEALTEVLCALPAASPGILVVQHMPPLFTASFAKRLDGLAALSVVEARDGTRIMPGHVHIAPGSMHLELARSGADYMCRVHDGPLVSGHRPSVDVLFHSAARCAGANALGVILTGMGRDGAEGLLKMRQTGSATVGQDESSCVVYGMPKAAYDLGGVAQQLPLDRIAESILSYSHEARQALRV
ncbi:MAG: chemotaxis response regulator protein-glutamate methylesterase [Alphaproteobacteria bacterium]|nr:MAG: chemotaxis response regulator protein-glutamate methylesterase [Alphaproteobacteria bacterium]